VYRDNGKSTNWGMKPEKFSNNKQKRLGKEGGGGGGTRQWGKKESLKNT